MTVSTAETGDTDLPQSSVDALVEAYGVVTCADPSARDAQPYVEERFNSVPSDHAWGWAATTLAGDLNGDGLPEVWTAQDRKLQRLTPTVDSLRPDTTPIPADPALRYSSGGALADFDGDGDLDVYVARWVGAPGPEPGSDPLDDVLGYNRLLRNDGPAGFVDVTEEAGGVHACDVVGEGFQCYRSTSVSWGDIDRDGDLDLFVGNHGYIDGSRVLPQDAHGPGEPDFLYRNEGDGTFTDISELLPRDHGYTFVGGFFDLDDDGWLDLYAVHDVGANEPNHVVWNRGGTLSFDPADASGLRVSMSGMGLGVGDLNGDGLPDLAMAEWANNVVLESRRDLGIWVDVAFNAGVSISGAQEVAWGSELADLDNDGDLDLLVQYGHLYEWGNTAWYNPERQPDAVYVNVGTPTQALFQDHATELGLASDGVTRAALVVDLDHDGWLDVVKHDLMGVDRVYRARCGAAGWLEIEVRQPDTLNVFGVGARIEVHAGSQRWVRTIHAGGTGFESAGPPEVHFGLGDVDAVDAIVVRWPDGEIAVLPGVETRQRVRITRVEPE